MRTWYKKGRRARGGVVIAIIALSISWTALSSSTFNSSNSSHQNVLPVLLRLREPYRPARLLHEGKFNAFITWAEFPKESSTPTGDGAEKVDLTKLKPPYAIQLVQQVNYGPLESKRYFIPVEGKDNEFTEVVENDLIQANFQKLNSYKNFKCESHNKFFEVNVYQKDPVNKQHWRVNIARPADLIDL